MKNKHEKEEERKVYIYNVSYILDDRYPVIYVYQYNYLYIVLYI